MLGYIKLFLFGVLITVNSCQNKGTVDTIDGVLGDTSIFISNEYKLVLQKNKEQEVIYYSKPFIRYQNKDIKLQLDIHTSKVECNFFVSPNEKRIVMHYIANNGYVYVSETDSFYHEVFKSSMISLKTGKVLVEELSSEDMSGYWDKNNHWVDSNGEILIK